ncbi:hypothetical protein [Massilia sp. DWR3-1-1]|uniref:hypothetical protein n=1 Tax=Massilia sp. DWR3-1-1 TaxID=2804559 RepID=UPI003CE90069
MTTDKHCDSDLPGMWPTTPAETHAHWALAQTARYAADVAIARWSGAAAAVLPERVAWLARAQHGLRQWFDAGGFAQDDGARTAGLADSAQTPTTASCTTSPAD